MTEVYIARKKAFLLFAKYCDLRGYTNDHWNRRQEEIGRSIWYMRTTEAVKEAQKWTTLTKQYRKLLKESK
jgi:hypothetical protein